jgi:two-component system, cell cycle sensor histidine kinase and response regulator CckA
LTSFLNWLFGSADFMSHGHCYMWNRSLVQLHVGSDLMIGIAYVAISLTLWRLVRAAKNDIPFHWMFIAFGAFIIACGATHFMEVWTIWTPTYWLTGTVKAVTAMASVVTAIALPPLVPKSLKLIGAAQLSEQRRRDLELANDSLTNEITERRRAETEIRHLNEELERRVLQRTRELEAANQEVAEKAQIVQHSNDAIFSRTLTGVITSWNPAAERLYGYTAAEVTGQNVRMLLPAEAPEPILHEDHPEPFETTALRKDGTSADVSVTISPVFDRDGNRTGASVIARDITERKKEDLRLRETQKLESLGVIAGGVAHDFNNLLVGVMGNASLVLDSISPSSVHHRRLEGVVSAAEKASDLTRQLLAYAGKGRFLTEQVDLSTLVREISTLIQTSVPRTVQLRLELADGLPAIEADPSQLQQVVMNLVINGAEAVPEGQNGTVLVTTEAQELDEPYLRQNFASETLAAGRYISLEVHDTGTGMSEEIRSRIFDPFFTTKFTGRGLGLAAVLGIVRGHKGTIRVYSHPGKGTTFKVLLPLTSVPSSPGNQPQPSEKMSGSGTILVVDDEEVVRTTCQTSLESYGYTVLVANEGRSGVEIFRKYAGEIALVILDMTMPVMSGEEAFRHMRTIRPDARIIVSSGYNETEATRRFAARGIAAFAQKPYTAANLAKIVKQVLDSAAHLPSDLR